MKQKNIILYLSVIENNPLCQLLEENIISPFKKGTKKSENLYICKNILQNSPEYVNVMQ